MTHHVAIIGAGLAGASSARALSRAGARATVFEKSGGTGGRLSTRRTDHGSFDHGAQYLTARSAGFAETLAELAAAGAAAQWRPAGKDRDTVWHVGMPGMSGLVKPLLHGIEVRPRCRIRAIRVERDGVRLIAEGGPVGVFDRVIVTAPAPQALDLVGELDPGFGAISEAVMAPCWAAMFAYRKRIGALPDMVRGDDASPLGWMARNGSKPGRYGAETVVVHAGAAWSADHLAEEADAVRGLLTTAMAERFGDDAGDPEFGVAHRWRYARVDRPAGLPFFSGCDGLVLACGDWCLGGRAEAAFDSGQAAAQRLIEELA